MRFIKLFFFSVLQLVLIERSSGQSLTATPQSIIPPSPNAASLAKFVETPVSYYTGIPRIDIPLYQIKEGDINVPVSMNYHSGGIKVDDVASSAGLGWSLSAGGTITRATRGLADDNTPVDEQKLNRYFNGQMAAQEEIDYLEAVLNGQYNTEYDMYYLSIGDLSCKFFINSAGKYLTLPRSANIDIKYNAQGYSWIVTDGSGIKYKFFDKETTTSTSFSKIDQGDETDAGFFTGTSSYYLNEIEDTKGNKVSFAYIASTSNFEIRGTQTVSIPYGGSGYAISKCYPYFSYSRSINSTDVLDIKSINFTNGSIVFDYLTSRQDNPGCFKLSAMSIKSGNRVLKSYNFYTSYFGASNIGTVNLMGYPAQDVVRLKLDSIVERSGSQSLKPYVFSYFDDVSLPYRNSYAQDHWGYANGKNNSVPLSYSLPIANGGTQYLGADKRCDAYYAKAATLTKIKYPTGGEVEYEYEGNKFLTKNEEYIRQVGRDTTFLIFYGQNNTSHFTFDFQTSFTVDNTLLAGRSEFNTNVSLVKEGYSEFCGCTIILKLIKPDNSEVFLNDGQNINLTAGTYQVQANITTEFNGNPFMTFTLYLKGRVATRYDGDFFEAEGPGLRVKKITKLFANNQSEINHYDYKTESGLSSGRVGNLPLYIRQVDNEYREIIIIGQSQAAHDYNCNCNLFSTVSNYPLINNQSSYVGYSRVKETFNSNAANGSKVYTYINYEDGSENIMPIYPYLPNNSYDWIPGVPLKNLIYAADNTIKQSKSMAYFPSADTSAFRSLRLGSSKNFTYYRPAVYASAYYLPASYGNSSNAFQLVADTTIIYDNTTTGIKTISSYTYSPVNYQLKQVVTNNSDNSQSVKNLFYPTDYIGNRSQSPVLDSMLKKRMFNIPVEEVNLKLRGSATIVESAVLNKFDLYYNTAIGKNQVVVKKVYERDASNSPMWTAFDFVTLPTYYAEKLNFTSFNKKGFSRGYQVKQAQHVSYQWAHMDNYPVAECNNADETEFYYQGFEDNLLVDSTGGAHTGRRSSNSAIVTWAAPNARVYVISYWYKAAGIWKYSAAQAYNGISFTMQGGSLYDDIRIHPKDAQMTTYTYDPLVGMTSSTDAKSQTTYYEYDGFQRLIYIKDQEGNILKSNDYHYKP